MRRAEKNTGDRRRERSERNWSPSLLTPGGPRRWPPRRSDLGVFLSAEARKHRTRRDQGNPELDQHNS
jgi:hypothetical protein